MYGENPFTPVPPEAEKNYSNKMAKMKLRQVITALTIFTVISLLMAGSGCKKDSGPALKSTYTLMVKDVLGVTGTVTFTETSSNLATIDITLNGAPSGTHPAELRMNSAVEGGNVVITLNPVNASGKSSTDETTLNYTQLIVYDGFISVSKSSSEPDVILAQGDIGGNVITSTNKSYVLDTVGAYLVSGSALFQKRVNGTTLVTITLNGVIAGELYPSSINLGSIESVGGGPVMKILNDIDGKTGKGYTNIRQLDSGIDITYDNWLVYDGYINIYQNSVSISNIICHGNIGSN